MSCIKDIKIAAAGMGRPESVDEFISYVWYVKFSAEQQLLANASGEPLAQDIMNFFSEQQLEEWYAQFCVERPKFERLIKI